MPRKTKIQIVAEIDEWAVLLVAAQAGAMAMCGHLPDEALLKKNGIAAQELPALVEPVMSRILLAVNDMMRTK